MQDTNIGSTMTGTTEQGAAAIERLGERAQEGVGKAAEATASAVRHAGQRGEELGRQWMDTEEAWAQNAREYVRAHPITSVVIAFGVGVLLNRLTSR